MHRNRKPTLSPSRLRRQALSHGDGLGWGDLAATLAVVGLFGGAALWLVHRLLAWALASPTMALMRLGS